MHVLIFTILSVLAAAAAAVLYAEDIQAPAVPFTVPTTVETLVASSAQVTCSNPNGKAAIRGWLDLTVGIGTTAITIALYEGSQVGGPVVGTKNPEAGDFTAGDTAHFEVEFLQYFSNVGSVQYCMSVLQTGATGDGTVKAALIDTKVLSG